MNEEVCSLVEFFTNSSSTDVLLLEKIIKTGVNLNEPILLNNEPYTSDHYIHPARDQRRPLHLAAMRGLTKMVEMLLDHEAKVDIRDLCENTALHTAAEAGHVETVQLLIDRGAAVSARDCSGNTPLHRTKSHKVAKVLLKNGASVKDKNVLGQSALHCVYSGPSSGNLSEIVQLLIDYGAEVNSKDGKGRSPLHLAAINSEELLVLITNGANVHLRDNSGSTALHKAFNSCTNVKVLLNHSASPDIQNDFGNTPLHLAALSEHEGVFLLMLRKGVKLDIQNSSGQTVLHETTYNNDVHFVSRLLSYGFSVNVKNEDGNTPYKVAKYGSACQRFLGTHIHLSRLAGLQVCEDVVVDIPLSEEEREKAVRELERIKVTNISEHLCLYDILEKFKRPSYLLDKGAVEEIEAYFQSTDFHGQFPMFGNILKGTFNRSKKSRYYLSKRAVRSMMSRTRKECCQVTADLVWELVCKFLSLDDLTNILRSEV